MNALFEEQGRWSHQMLVKADADQDHDGLIFLNDGRVLLVRGLQLALLTASGNLRQLNITSAIAVAINLAANFILIPRMGVLGAAISCLLTQAFVGNPLFA